MIKIGFIGLDTSHPASFHEILSDMEGVEVSGVYDDNSIQDSKYVQEFCQTRDMKNCASLEELKDNIDAVMILAVNWDNHLTWAKPFLDSSKPVYIDKPIAGNIKDLREFEKYARENPHLLMAGSGWRFNDVALQARENVKNNSVVNVYTESRMPRYFYGIHAVELMVGLLCNDIKSVQTLQWNDDESDPEGALICVNSGKGASGLVRLVATQDYWRGAIYSVNGKHNKVTFTGEQIHESVCHTFIDSIKNKTAVEKPETVVLSVKIMLAAKMSANNNGAVININDIDDAIKYDGNEFNKQYKEHGAIAPMAIKSQL